MNRPVWILVLVQALLNVILQYFIEEGGITSVPHTSLCWQTFLCVPVLFVMYKPGYCFFQVLSYYQLFA